MGDVRILPRMFTRRKAETHEVIDPYLSAVITVQSVLAELPDEVAQFVVETVQRNLELNRRHRRAYDVED